jgi:hypothetical protein
MSSTASTPAKKYSHKLKKIRNVRRKGHWSVFGILHPGLLSYVPKFKPSGGGVKHSVVVYSRASRALYYISRMLLFLVGSVIIFP